MSQYAQRGTQSNEKRLYDLIREAIDDRINRQRQVRPAILGKGCDGLPAFNLLGPSGDACGEAASGSIVYAGLIGHVPVQMGPTSRPYAGTAASLPISVARSTFVYRDKGRRFADSQGNLWGEAGEILGSWNATSAAALGVDYAPVAKIGRFRYEYDDEDPGTYMEHFGSGARVDTAFSFGGVSYPMGVIANWDWADPTRYSDVYPGDPAAVGVGLTHKPPVSYKSDHICLCVEAMVTGGPESRPLTAYGLTVRDVQNGMTNASIFARVDTMPGTFVYPMSLVSGSGASAVAVRNMWNVTAAPDGAFWIHDAGNKDMYRVLFDISLGTIVQTERLTLGVGGTAWGSKTIAKQVR